MNIAITNAKELKEKYQSVNIDKYLEKWMNYYAQREFKEKTKSIWINEIKNFIILENLDHYEIEGRYTEDDEGDIKDKEDFTYIDEKGKEKISIPKLVDHLIEKHSFKTIFGKKDEIIYMYCKGVYEQKGREFIKTKTESLLDWRCTTKIVNEVLEKVKRKTAIDYDKFENVPEHLICLENGIFNLKEKKLGDYDPEIYFKSKLPITYNQNAKSVKILKFIDEACYPEDIPVIQEWFGFSLYRKYFIKKAMILFGEKNTGKTILLNLLTKFIGEKNISGISLQKIASKDKFALSFLKNRYVNCYDDLSSDDLSDSGGFKIATGGGYITGEHKFGDSFQFMTFAKNIFATNHIPNVKDINDDAYYERWIPIPFDNQVEKIDQDNFLMEKLLEKEEMSGLFNWALEGLSRLLTNGSFSYNKNSDDIKRIMQRQNNPLVMFCDEVISQKDGNRVTKEIMYQVYTKWCNEKGVPRLSKEQLGRRLAKHTGYLIAKGGKERVWENVLINNSYDIFDTYK